MYDEGPFVEADFGLVERASGVLVGGFWAYRTERFVGGQGYHDFDGAFDGHEEDFRDLCSPQYAMQGATRQLLAVAAPMLVVRHRGVRALIQLAGDQVEWAPGGLPSRFNAGRRRRLTTRRLRILRQRRPVGLRKHRLMMARAPKRFRLPYPVARWLLESKERVALSGWDVYTLVRWALRKPDDGSLL